MSHKFKVGVSVNFEAGNLNPAARGIYKVVRQLPIERDTQVMYRIKSAAETFERIADEQQLRRAE